MNHDLVIVRSILVSGPHYDTTVEVQNLAHDDGRGPTVAISQSRESAANPDQSSESVAFTWEEWQAVEDHVSTVHAIWGNPDRDTPAYTADQALGPEEPPTAVLSPYQVGGQCIARNLDSERCWLPDGHAPVRWRSGPRGTALATSQQIAGHVLPNGELFWVGV